MMKTYLLIDLNQITQNTEDCSLENVENHAKMTKHSDRVFNLQILSNENCGFQQDIYPSSAMQQRCDKNAQQ